MYESIVEMRVREMLDRQLQEAQTGFRKGRSCQDHTFTLIQILEKRVHDQKIYTSLVNILEVFDSVPKNKCGRA